LRTPPVNIYPNVPGTRLASDYRMKNRDTEQLDKRLRNFMNQIRCAVHGDTRISEVWILEEYGCIAKEQKMESSFIFDG